MAAIPLVVELLSESTERHLVVLSLKKGKIQPEQNLD